MRKTYHKLTSLAISACLLFSLLMIPAAATTAQKTATLEYDSIQITLDKEALVPTDANGAAVEPFIIDGTTYLPVRGIANAMGLDVSWDQATSTVTLTTKAAGTTAAPAPDAPAPATSEKKTAALEYSDIKITLDGKALTPTDANGAAVEPFIIDGTTYLPVRGIANAMGLDVSWDQATKTVALTTKAAKPPATETPAPEPTPGEEPASNAYLEITESGYTVVESYGKIYVYYALAITNKSSTTAVRFPTYTITALDASGATMKTNKQVLWDIAPGETVFFGAQGLALEQRPSSVQFETVAPEARNLVKPEAMATPITTPLITENIKQDNDKITGDVVNNNGIEVSRALVTVIFRDDDGKILAGGTTFVDDIGANSKLPFEINTKIMHKEYVTSKIEVYATPWM